ncbi:MAG: ABC-F family ATP-binding cassette domain-containing protein [Erysipelotrichales bacterium]|nr:MAG: ABC-F family ATP-binding cassette domain-containing protein [Erysipelotrichales bacterium]
MLVLQSITITTPKGRVLLRDLSFSVQQGDKLAIIGEEGNGKSTLCKLIADPRILLESFVVEGNIQRDQLPIAYLPQQLDESELSRPIQDFMMRDETGNVDYGKFAEVKRWLGKFNVLPDDHRFEEPLCNFSGGERIKIQLARLMTMRPGLLVLDEPTNDLDIPTLKWLENFIISSELPILFVSHDETLLTRCANRILHLEQTEKKAVPLWTYVSMGYVAYKDARSLHLQRQTSLSRKQKMEYDRQIEKWRQIYQKVEHAQATISRQDPAGARLLKKKIKNLKAVKERIDGEEKIKKPDPEEAVTLYFNDHEDVYAQRCLLDDELGELRIKDRCLAHHLELKVFGKARIGIIGNNGSGKSTYLDHLYRSACRKGTRVAYMPQNYERLLSDDQSPVEYLTITGTKEEKTSIMTYLGNLKFTEEEMRQPIANCSQGQKAKILLTSLVFSDADLLILDEPTRNLSPLTLPVIETMLKMYHGAMIAVSHDRRFLRNLTSQRFLFDVNGLHDITSDERILE